MVVQHREHTSLSLPRPRARASRIRRRSPPAANPVNLGDAVATYLYGLGAVELRDDPFGRFEPVQSFDLHFDYRPNAPGSRAAVGAPGGGLYQVNFIVPPPPAGTILAECDGKIIRSNLTVTLSGINSFDSASFCVRP